MRVLVLEAERGAAAGAAAQLEAEGHQVARCHEAGAPAFPCAGMHDGGSCPLESEPVDVALVVRSPECHAVPEASDPAGEDGARCALRHHVPLVVAGAVERSPHTPFAAVVTPSADDVGPAVRAAAEAPLPRHIAAATAAFEQALVVHGIDPRGADVDVRRNGGQLLVTLVPPIPLEQAVVDMASVRVVGVVRALDPNPTVIDVVCTDPA